MKTLLQDRNFRRNRRDFLDNLGFDFDKEPETKKSDDWSMTSKKSDFGATEEKKSVFGESRFDERFDERKSTSYDQSNTLPKNDPKNRYQENHHNSLDSDLRGKSGDHAYCRSRSADEKPFCIDGNGQVLTCLNIKKCPAPSYLGFSTITLH